MNQAQSTPENDVMNVSRAGLEELASRRQRRAQVVHWNNPVASEKYSLEGMPALLFFWDGQKIHRIRSAQHQEEMARIIDNNL